MPTREPPRIQDLPGLWRRSLIAWPDGRQDVTTRVFWLQGDSAFLDLRQPALPLDLRNKHRLLDLTLEDCRWLARQEGFAGQLTFDGTHFEWARLIDYQPTSPYADAASLGWDGAVLVEQGRDIDYTEHWHRADAGDVVPSAAATLRLCDSGAKGVLLRVGTHFMFARDRSTAPPACKTLTDCVSEISSLEYARALIDCEISLGTVSDRGFIIEASTLPYRVGDHLAPRGTGHSLTTTDRSADGGTALRQWEIIDGAGDLGALGVDEIARGPSKRRVSPSNPAREAPPRDASTIPLIDIGPLYSGDERAKRRVAHELRAAATTAGVFYVTGHGMAETLYDDLLEVSKRFFAQSIDEKMKFYIGNSSNHRGYVPEGEEVFAEGTKDAKEAYDLARDLPAEDPDYRAGIPLLGPNQWPELTGFKAAVDRYYRATFEVGCSLMRGFALALGEEPDFFDPFLTKPPSQLRLIHYPFNPHAADAPGIGAHTDYECFTLLRATGPGLEVKNATGAWIDAPPIADAYIVNIGDMLELWTNGEYVATTHRVRKVQEERYSFPFFFAVDYHTHVSPMPRFIHDDRPAREGLIAGEHLFAQTARTFNYLRRRLVGQPTQLGTAQGSP